MSGVMMDIDGVIADFAVGFSKLGNRRYGLPVVQNADVPDWSWSESGWCTPGQEDALWRHIRKSCDFWERLDLLPNVTGADIDVLAERHRDIPIVFVTSRVGVNTWRQTVNWLEKLDIMEPLVVVSGKGDRKPDICRRLNIDLAVEDSPGQLREFNGSMHPVNTIKVLAKYNQNAPAWLVVPSLGEALGIVKALHPL